MSEEKKPQFTLVPLEKEEGELVVARLQAWLSENGVEIVAGPIIAPNGTLGAEVKLFKKLELVPKGSVPFPNEILEENGGEEAKA